MIPILGVVSESTGPVSPTPQFKRWPITGALLVATQLTSTQKQTLSVLFTDSKGNPAPVDGQPAWGVDNPNVLALVPSADGLSCTVAAIGPLGNARVSIQADADLGPGVTSLAGVYDVEVIAGQATTVEITGGPVEEQGAASKLAQAKKKGG
jgi:hypothetical protein